MGSIFENGVNNSISESMRALVNVLDDVEVMVVPEPADAG